VLTAYVQSCLHLRLILLTLDELSNITRQREMCKPHKCSQAVYYVYVFSSGVICNETAEWRSAVGHDQCLLVVVNRLSHHRTRHPSLDRDVVFFRLRHVVRARNVSASRSMDGLLQ